MYPTRPIASYNGWPFYTPRQPCHWCRRTAWWFFVGGPAFAFWIIVIRML